MIRKIKASQQIFAWIIEGKVKVLKQDIPKNQKY